jgi:hypothetical protein
MANDQITDQTMLSQRWPGAGSSVTYELLLAVLLVVENKLAAWLLR